MPTTNSPYTSHWLARGAAASLFVTLAFVTPVARAHEDTAGHADLVLGQPPEYLHVLSHSVLVVGLAVALIALVAGWLARSKAAQIIGLSLVLVSSAAAWPVLGLGQNAYNRIRPQADETGKQWLSEHMRRAETFVYVFYGTSALAALALVSHHKWPKAKPALTASVVLFTCVSIATGAWISTAGGRVRHPEFRPPGVEPPHSESNHSH